MLYPHTKKPIRLTLQTAITLQAVMSKYNLKDNLS